MSVGVHAEDRKTEVQVKQVRNKHPHCLIDYVLEFNTCTQIFPFYILLAKELPATILDQE